MSVYHINPESGDVAACRAQKGKCPFGSLDQHFTSAEAARAAYEESQFAVPKITGVTTGEPVIYDFLEGQLEYAKAAIDKANRRLEKAGLKERFTYTAETYMAPKPEKNANGLLQPRVKFELNTPSIGYEGYTFLAAVENAEAGFVVKQATGVSLGGYSPEDLRCDACGRAMKRQKTYLVEDSEGKMLQVGSSCIKNYFGVQPEGLWALTFDPIEREENSDRWERGAAATQNAAPTENVMAYALAVSEGGEKFVSGASASNYGGSSTADTVKSLFSSNDGVWVAEMTEKAQKYIDSGEVKRLIEKLKKSSTNTDYGRNMAVISAGENTSWRHMAILVSGLSEIAREKREAAKAAADAEWGTPAAGFAGEIKSSMAGKKLKVREVHHTTESDPYSWNGAEIEKTRVNFRDENNHEIVWWASKRIDVEKGEEIEVKSGSVKKHENFRGVDQTTISNVRLKQD